MATFLGIHDMGGAVPAEKMAANWSAYKEACSKLGGKGLHVHFNVDKGKAFCLTEAESADNVQKAHDDAGVPVNEIIEVQSAE